MTRIFVLAILAVTLIAARPSLAVEEMGHDISMSKEDKELQYKNIQELASMMKEVMVILRDLNHYPGDQQKKRLDEMIRKTDEISKKSGGY